MAEPFAARILRRTTRTITFANATGQGAIGTVNVANLNTGGAVWVQQMSCVVATTLTGTGATLSLGTVGNTTAFYTTETATTFTAGKIISGQGSPVIGVDQDDPYLSFIMVLPLIFTVATAAVTGGVLVFTYYWLPLQGSSAPGVLS